jgi:hypothetical protein
MMEAPMMAHLNNGSFLLDLSSYVLGGGGGYNGTGGLQSVPKFWLGVKVPSLLGSSIAQ